MSFEQVNHLNIFNTVLKNHRKKYHSKFYYIASEASNFFYEFSRQKSQKCLIWIFMPKNNPNLSNIWIFALKIVDGDFMLGLGAKIQIFFSAKEFLFSGLGSGLVLGVKIQSKNKPILGDFPKFF